MSSLVPFKTLYINVFLVERGHYLFEVKHHWLQHLFYISFQRCKTKKIISTCSTALTY